MSIRPRGKRRRHTSVPIEMYHNRVTIARERIQGDFIYQRMSRKIFSEIDFGYFQSFDDIIFYNFHDFQQCIFYILSVFTTPV